MSGWQLSGDAPSLYNQFAIRAMEQWTDDLIRQANCKDGERVLDVACGTGFVTLRIKEVSGADCELTGLDMNEGMLNAARKNPGVNWQLGSATAMPFPDASFDVVLCQQGLQYFPDRQAAMNEFGIIQGDAIHSNQPPSRGNPRKADPVLLPACEQARGMTEPP
jgi:SAM-dependent methyltransferase